MPALGNRVVGVGAMVVHEDGRAVGFCHSSAGPSDRKHTVPCSTATLGLLLYLHALSVTRAPLVKEKAIYFDNKGRVA